VRSRHAVVPREDAAREPRAESPGDLERFDLRVCLPLVAVHAGCLLAFATGASPTALAACGTLFALRAFGLTAGYHRYFAHRAYRTSRAFQLALAWLGASAAQLGPLWWAAHHRLHHRHSDTARDVHSPHARSLWWAHLGWLVCRKHSATRLDAIPDFAGYPELRFLDRWHALAPLSLVLALYAAGEWLRARAPGLGTSGAQLVVWGFFVGTTLLYHVTFAVNSLGHALGSRPFDTPDRSRNNALLALVTLGDGWHNNHHARPGLARHGLRWWELDATWLGLRGLAKLGLVWDLREPGARPRPHAGRRRHAGAVDARGRRSAMPAPTAAAHASPKRSPTRA
jgi:stearoyl-CoA desaturase (delta-9 desaturase)